eukprot:11363205-Ditylum_brightwellii.AAC.2
MSLLMIHHLKESKKIGFIHIVECLRQEKALKVLQENNKWRKKKQQRFFQSRISDTENNPSFLCCKAVGELFEIGYYRMNQLSKPVDLPYLPKHGLVAKPAAWAKSPSQLSLCDKH